MRRFVPLIAGLVAWGLVVPGLDAAMVDLQPSPPTEDATQGSTESTDSRGSEESATSAEASSTLALPVEIRRMLEKLDVRRSQVMSKLGISMEDDSVSTYVIGGANAAIEDVPWQVFLAYGFDYSNGGEIDFNGENPFVYQFFCGGSIIGAQWIVTAAHCVEFDSRPYLYVAAGVDNNKGLWRESFHQVSQIYVHPAYDYVIDNDIALLKLSEPIDLDGVPDAIELPSEVPDSWPAAGTPGVISGWGVSQFNDSGIVYPANLQKGNVFVLSGRNTYQCGLWGYINAETTMCVGRPQAETSACYGDSGGPMAIEFESKKILAGVTSWGPMYCAEPGFPNGYTRVTTYVQWVESITRSPLGVPIITSITGANRSLVVTVDDSDLTGDPVTNYQYSLNNGRWTSVSPADPDGEFSIGGLKNGRRYSVRVRAVNDFGVSDPSPLVNGTPVATLASAATINSILPDNRSLRIDFNAPLDDGGSKITAYEYSINGGRSWITLRSTSSPLTIKGLKNGKEYTVIIRARTVDGPGEPSGPAVGTPGIPPKR